MKACFLKSPEICVEVLSPANTGAEIEEKMALYFDAGAQEVWICGESGEMKFFRSGQPSPQSSSEICPVFPPQIQLRPLD